MNHKDKNAEKNERHKMMDPRMGMIAKSLSAMPGSPDGNPYPVIQAQSPRITGQSIYGDHFQNYDQMQTVNPEEVPRSPVPPNMPIAARGFQANAPYGMQQQPPAQAADSMESMRYNMRNPGPPSPMGLTGMPATPAPGALPFQMPGTTGPSLMPGIPGENLMAGGMAGGVQPPGTTPVKKNQPKRGKA